MTRLALLSPDSLNAAQRKIYESVTQGPRKKNTKTDSGFDLETPSGLSGPFNAWLFSPVTGNLAQELGAALRYSNSLPNNLLEIAVLVVAKFWVSQFEFWAHARLARAAGVSPEAIEAIRMGEAPQFSKPEEQQIYSFAKEFLDTKRISDTTYATTREFIGEQGLADLAMLMGYYCLVAMTLNCFEVPIPEGQVKPFIDPP